MRWSMRGSLGAGELLLPDAEDCIAQEAASDWFAVLRSRGLNVAIGPERDIGVAPKQPLVGGREPYPFEA